MKTDDGFDTDEANANLIRLLDALEALVNADNCNYTVETMRYEGLFDVARAVIAKMKGDTHE